MTDIRVLIVDDDFRVAQIHSEFVERVPGFAVVGMAHTASVCAEAVAQLQPDLILLDLYLPDEHGLSLLHRLRDGAGPHPDVVAITAARDIASVRAAMQLGVVYYLVKPFRFEALRQRLGSYRELRDRTGALAEADQGDVDEMFRLLRSPDPVTLPKGHSAPTLAAVQGAFDGAGETDLSAAQVAEKAGISRPTAQRYLAYLVRAGALEIHLRYGTAGRPEHRYRPARP
jgi:response regulator of citrate/malate metabolism